MVAGTKALAFLNSIIKPTVGLLGMPDQSSASLLLLGTAVHESLNFHYRRQRGGPARSYYQMESPTFDDTWTRGVANHPARLQVISSMVSGHAPKFSDMETNDRFATAMARVKYLLAPAHMPHVVGEWPSNTELNALAHYWKKYYNTSMGKGTVDEFVEHWRLFVHE